MRRTRLALVSALTVGLLAACTGGSSMNSTGPSSVAVPPPPSGGPSERSESASPAGPPPAITFDPSGGQVAELAHLRAFLDAYDAGDLAGALAQFSLTQPVGFSDCKYPSQQLVAGEGRTELTDWLRRNIADRDQLVLGDVAANPEEPLGVLGVSFSRRSSAAIAQAGYPDGIVPPTAAKVKFDAAGLLTEFNNGPYGAPPGGCRIR